MSDRMDFFEIRCGTYDNWDHVCLVKDQEEAEKIMKLLDQHYPRDLFIEHMEIIARVDLEEGEY